MKSRNRENGIEESRKWNREIAKMKSRNLESRNRDCEIAKSRNLKSRNREIWNREIAKSEIAKSGHRPGTISPLQELARIRQPPSWRRPGGTPARPAREGQPARPARRASRARLGPLRGPKSSYSPIPFNVGLNLVGFLIVFREKWPGMVENGPATTPRGSISEAF